ncbi:helix-turn-helix transcriptional regulator [Arthrobacter sp. CDRTa11]|uniref:ArsR/SmtB family transcription factor n=1 Tax=Arthrobacter sp. CDRTa11 TaxID=2651199 RepID=UPI002265AA64|nr:metalloregulator ArsR/SmtB family transcription factor [Arthrobacter sp. CDRTa11]UZX01965.1 helix-turn-helix transcriptional regulator [Arthrobacter sp. CDRTa11]
MLNNSSEADLDLVFQALADPTRRAIVVRLCIGPASVSELARPFTMSLPAVVQHLQVLENSGLVKSQKIGRVRTCSIVPATVRLAESWLGARRTASERILDRLEAFLAAEPEATELKVPETPDPSNPHTKTFPPNPPRST